MTLTEYTGKKYISKDTQTTKLIERNNQFQIEIINPQSITSSLKKIYHDILPISFWQCNHILLFDWINKVFTQGGKSWTISKETKKKSLQRSDLWFYRQMLEILWKAYMSDRNILKEANTQRQFITNIRVTAIIFGNIMRRDNWNLL